MIKLNVLVVDDDSICCFEMADFLRRLGHHVDECTNGLDALNRMENNYYEMVLTDIKMPRMSGIDMLKSFTRTPKRINTDVVLITGYGDIGFAIEAIRAGAFDYLLKPINVKELALITERIYNRHCNKIIKVLLYITNTIVREGVKHVLQHEKDFDVLGQTNSLHETFHAIEKTKPDVLLIRTKNPHEENELNSFKVNAGYKTIALCSSGVGSIKYPLMSNFDGILSLETELDEIVLAIKTVQRGVPYVSSNISEKILIQRKLDDEISKLNEQEIKIFYYLAQGKTNMEIAKEMYLSSATVKTYVSKILQKLNIPNRVAAAVYAAKAYENVYS